ncbi:YfhE family protein [Siminovitchia sediminis]|uniref:YfhE family protein n=1 Tax=Siminovitchia sediminis TaxID=1274353 RepID=A0ABW4KKV6_9BACI
MAKSQYQPARNLQLSDAQEVHYNKEYKKADKAFKRHQKQMNDQ